MKVRTRKPVKIGARPSKIYDCSRYLEPGFAYKAKIAGRTVRLPKNLYGQFLSPGGNLVNVPLGTDPSNRDPNVRAHRIALGQRIDDGFIPAWECPIAGRVLDVDDERELFGENAQPCLEHDSGWRPGDRFAPVKLCPHLVKIQEAQRSAAAKVSDEWKAKVAAASDAKQIRQLLSQLAEQPKVRTRSK